MMRDDPASPNERRAARRQAAVRRRARQPLTDITALPVPIEGRAGGDRDFLPASLEVLETPPPFKMTLRVYVLCGALFHASWNAIVKAQDDHSLAALVVAVFAGCFGIPFMLALPAPPPTAWPYVVASSLIHVGYFVLVGFAYRSADLGVAYPLTRGSAPLMTALIAFLFLSEALAWNGWLAIVVLAEGLTAEAGERGEGK